MRYFEEGKLIKFSFRFSFIVVRFTEVQWKHVLLSAFVLLSHKSGDTIPKYSNENQLAALYGFGYVAVGVLHLGPSIQQGCRDFRKHSDEGHLVAARIRGHSLQGDVRQICIVFS